MRLMAVHAHPDDESSRGAATLAKYAAEGHEVLVVTATGGERGDILNPAMNLPGNHENLSDVRREEMALAAKTLGVEHHWLGFMDSGLQLDPSLLPGDGFARVPLAESVPRLVEVIRRFRPDVMITYNECGGYPHPDHIRCHQLAVAAYEACEEVRKLYYFHEIVRVTPAMVKLAGRVERIISRRRSDAAPKDPRVGDVAVPGWVRRVSSVTRRLRGRRVTTEVSCAEYFPVRDKALRAHASQVDPSGPFFLVPWTWRQQLWPTEKFELAHTRVSTSAPETDLFAGL
ncbi:mycothiol conjugate amidase Mca [Mycolicibacterium phlei]|uniref:mycothiol conjugate amidase Mca n=1 Tax=Mycobacteroides chelonae TaxID=1774 RepID=UPI000618A71B|nr:mycothiol conjugate amidase Mca [Mycobacteroides chelonae]VEG19920.1 mycothiol conjugate amidase Mca [Mycolicibacterium phlei]AKC40355.1 GlcNAc-PI de-N-acetylase [Mycobacteroides chelonae]ANA99995.1 GlcNAc-PI de-N-acetylase [Mycobacteroides chelonae CCUG 47445]OLT82232.1 mycothiol conjugate amidase Mca [Mycobacteroides chelonae]ORV15790.1 mycothiol conjugate amidase Mca [Mycobacteroides chelonae]